MFSPTSANFASLQEDAVDPRIQIELECLNSATDTINKLELELDEARTAFRLLLAESTTRIDALAKKLGSCVEKARPYYDARMHTKEMMLEMQKAAVRFERANSAHSAAKEMVFLAEEGLLADGRTFDHAWQEMLNHATKRVNESEKEKTDSEEEHRRTSMDYQKAELKVQQLQKELKRAITKSSMNTRRNLLKINNLANYHQLLLLPYFEMKAHFNHLMEEQKKRVKELEKAVGDSKNSYASSLHSLEEISDEIHQRRKIQAEFTEFLGARGDGVGAESPVLRRKQDTSREGVACDEEEKLNDEFLKLPEKLTPASSPFHNKSTPEYEPEYLVLPPRSSESEDIAVNQDSVETTEVSGSDRLLEEDTKNISVPSEETKHDDSDADTINGDEEVPPPPQIKEKLSMEEVRSASLVRESLKLPLEMDLLQIKSDKEEMSDTESLASVEMLNDDQIDNLMLDKEIRDACEEIVGTPVTEFVPFIPPEYQI